MPDKRIRKYILRIMIIKFGVKLMITFVAESLLHDNRYFTEQSVIPVVLYYIYRSKLIELAI